MDVWSSCKVCLSKLQSVCRRKYCCWNSKQRHHIKKRDMELIQGIVDECDQYSNSSLMQIIFKQSPYRDVYQKYFHNTISNKTLKDFFEEE